MHLAAGGCIGDIGDTLDFLFLYEVGDAFDEIILYDSIRDLGNHNLVMIAVRLNLRLGSDHNASAPRLVSGFYSGHTENFSAGREVRGLYILHEPFNIHIRIIDKSQ